MAWKKYFLEEMEYEETGNSQFKKKKKTEERPDLRTLRK